MTKFSNDPNKKNNFDLEKRTYNFAKNCRDYIKNLPKTLSNLEYSKQLIKASGSVAGNYIEAKESLSKKEFKNRIKICRKEAKEARLWIKLTEPLKENISIKNKLIKEATELLKIFNSIILKI